MVEGVQFRSFAQAAAATLKLLRSAHSRTLPAKNTITVTGQLIGRVWARGIPVAAGSGFKGIAFSPDRLAQRRSRLSSLFHYFLDDTPYAPSITGKVSTEGCSAE